MTRYKWRGDTNIDCSDSLRYKCHDKTIYNWVMIESVIQAMHSTNDSLRNEMTMMMMRRRRTMIPLRRRQGMCPLCSLRIAARSPCWVPCNDSARIQKS